MLLHISYNLTSVLLHCCARTRAVSRGLNAGELPEDERIVRIAQQGGVSQARLDSRSRGPAPSPKYRIPHWGPCFPAADRLNVVSVKLGGTVLYLGRFYVERSIGDVGVRYRDSGRATDLSRTDRDAGRRSAIPGIRRRAHGARPANPAGAHRERKQVRRLAGHPFGSASDRDGGDVGLRQHRSALGVETDRLVK